MLLELARLKWQGDEDRMQAQLAALGQMPALNWVLPLTALPSLEDVAYWQDWLAHPSYDDYWRPLSIDEGYSRIAVPALHVGGWYDVFANGTVDNFAGLRAGAGSEDTTGGQKLVVGPWYHGPWRPLAGAGAEAGANVFDDWQLRWFDHVLKGEENGVLDAPATVYVMGDGWRDLQDWPPPNARPTDWFLHSGGRANTATGDGWLSTEAPGDELPTRSSTTRATPHCPWRPLVLRRGDLARGTRLSRRLRDGARRPLLHVRAARARRRPPRRHRAHALCGDERGRHRLDVADCVWSTTAPARRISRRESSAPRYRDSTSEPTPVRPGEIVEYRIRLGPVGWRLKAGQRLRVDVSSSDFPQWDRNLNTGGMPGQEGPVAAVMATQVVIHNQAHPSRITLPMVE